MKLKDASNFDWNSLSDEFTLRELQTVPSLQLLGYRIEGETLIIQRLPSVIQLKGLGIYGHYIRCLLEIGDSIGRGFPEALKMLDSRQLFGLAFELAQGLPLEIPVSDLEPVG